MFNLKLSHFLPPELRTDVAIDKLYEIGLIVKPLTTQSTTRRHWISHPITNILIFIYYIFMFSIFVVNNNHNKRLVIILGDFPSLYGVGIYLNLPGLFCTIFNLLALSLYYYNHWKGIKPTFLRVFAMLSGLVTPNSVGLTDTQLVYKFIRKSKIIFKIIAFIHNKTLPLMGFIAFVAYICFTTLFDTLVFGSIYTLTFGLLCNAVFRLLLWQMTYFYLLCDYLCIKIKDIQKILIQKKRKNLRHILLKIDKLCAEINDYNSTYWCKYLALVWFIIGLIAVSVLYVVTFLDLSPIPKLILIYALLFLVINITVIMMCASAISFNFGKLYVKLNHLYINLTINI